MAGVGRGPGRGEPSIEPCFDAAAPGALPNAQQQWSVAGYAENAFNHSRRFDPGVKLLSMIATSLLVSSAGC